MKLEHSLTPYAELNAEWIKDLDVMPDTIKLIEENIGRALFDINHSKICLSLPPWIMRVKTERSKWYLIKLKNFCTAMETINKVKRQTSEWQKISVNKATDERLIPQICQKLM